MRAALRSPSSNAIAGAAATENTRPNAIPLGDARAGPALENTFCAKAESSSATTTPIPLSSVKKTHSEQGAKHTLNDARKHTIHDPEYDVELGKMMDIPSELSHLANSELKYILTSLAQPTDPILRRSTGSEGKLVFQNFLSEDVLLCEHNFRDPKLAAFHMDDIVQLQIEQAGVSGKFKHIIRKHISSEITNEMLHRCNVDEEKEMSPSELTQFLTQTPNGKSSLRIANRNQLVVCKGIIVKEDSGDDKPLYSVFLQTEPKDK